jgi:type VI secretion system protein ImpA
MNNLLKEISSDSKCGEDLEYEEAFQKMEKAAIGEAENLIGNPGEELKRKNQLPSQDWKKVRDQATKLLEKTRDIRLTVMLTRAFAHTQDLEGVDQSLTLTCELLERYWDLVHPQKDQEDDYPIRRINALTTLTDYDSFLKPVKHIKLVELPGIGSFSWHDIEVAKGLNVPADDKSEIPKMAVIEAAFLDSDLDFASLKSNTKSVEHLTGQIEKLQKLLVEKVGDENAPKFSNLLELLTDIHSLLQEQVSRNEEKRKKEQPQSFKNGESTTDQAPGYSQFEGINTREEVIQSIEAIELYFDRYEPSSPVPFLLQRAKKLLAMNFIEIMQDMAPESLSQVESICGMINFDNSNTDNS